MKTTCFRHDMTMKRKFACVCLLLTLSTAATASVDLTLNVACNDGSRLVTRELQALIDGVSAQGGGRAIVPKGTYKTGTIWLKHNVNLHLEEGATLLGSENLAYYNREDAYPQNFGARFEGWQGKHLIICVGQVNVAITGKGTIDGNGRAFFGPPRPGDNDYVWRKGYANAKDMENAARPGQLIAIVETSNAVIEGVNIVDSPSWTCFFHGCVGVDVGKLKIRNPLCNATTDGIDIDACRFVRIGDCDIETGDDIIAIRSCPERLGNGMTICENVIVSNICGACSADGVRVGVGNGLIRNVRFSNLRFREAGRAVTITTSYPAGKTSFTGISDISFNGLFCGDSGQAILVSGSNPLADRELRNIVFRNLAIATTGGIVIEGVGKTRPTNIIIDRMLLTRIPLARPKSAPDWETAGMVRTNLAAVCVEAADDVRICGLEFAQAKGEGRLRPAEIATRDAEINLAKCDVIPKPRKCTFTGGFWNAVDPNDGSCPKYDFIKDDRLGPEAYCLSVAEKGVSITAADDEGRFRALTTLRQLGKRIGDVVSVPCCEIEDAPAYSWRGLMLDECRHFFGFETVCRTLDLMAEYKLNVFHWHLTDDQGWRLAIDRFPELARYASVRPYSPPYGKTEGSNGTPYGPFFYTAGQVREIVARAKARHIRIVPEIDFPGHSRAVLAAYPEFACDPESVTNRTPWCTYGISEEVICAGNDRAMKFYEEVLDAVCELFPDEVIHLGGDECPTKYWKKCPKCQARIRREGLTDVSQLQGSVTRQFCRYLEGKGRRLMAWDEAMLPGTDMIVQDWHGGKSLLDAVTNGMDTVANQYTDCYLSLRQGCADDPCQYTDWTSFRKLTLKRIFEWNPRALVPPSARRRILGSEACSWTEWTPDVTMLFYKNWPRTLGFAEAMWTADPQRDYGEFRRRAALHRAILLGPKWHVNCAPLE